MEGHPHVPVHGGLAGDDESFPPPQPQTPPSEEQIAGQLVGLEHRLSEQLGSLETKLDNLMKRNPFRGAGLVLGKPGSAPRRLSVHSDRGHWSRDVSPKAKWASTALSTPTAKEHDHSSGWTSAPPSAFRMDLGFPGRRRSGRRRSHQEDEREAAETEAAETEAPHTNGTSRPELREAAQSNSNPNSPLKLAQQHMPLALPENPNRPKPAAGSSQLGDGSVPVSDPGLQATRSHASSGPRGSAQSRKASAAESNHLALLKNLTDQAQDNNDGDSNRGSQHRKESEMRQKLMKRMDTFRAQQVEYGIVGRVVVSSYFDFAITVVVVMNALLIGAQVQHAAVSDSNVEAFDILEHLCTFIFLTELIARLSVHRGQFFLNPLERWWNIFDFFLVGISLLDTTVTLTLSGGGLDGPGAFVGKLGRVIRMFRIMRIIRTVRFLSQLRVMMHMIISSLQSLFWILVIMLGLIYIFAVVLTQGATDYLKDPNVSPETLQYYHEVNHMYGSLFDTMYTLFQCMSGGLSWSVASQPMRGPGWVLEAIVIGYVFFMIFAVANIVNGVFVDGAIELAKRDRTTMMQKQRERDENKESHLVDLLTIMDSDGDNLITDEEFLESLEKQEIRDYISALDVEINDAKEFFSLLDADGSGQVDIIEFVTGMQKFRGEAKSIDIHMMLHENRKLFKVVGGLVGVLMEQWEGQEGPGDSNDCD